MKLPDTVPLTGKVTLDSKPLAGASVMFTPARGNDKGHPASGRTDAAGAFELKTSVGNNLLPGATPGSYKVYISLRTAADGKPIDLLSKTPQPGKESLKPEYSDVAQTKLTADVPKEGGKKDFDLKSK